MNLRTSKCDLICFTVLLLVVFQNALMYMIIAASYIDELLTMALVILVIIHALRNNRLELTRFDCFTGLALFTYGLTTMASSYLYGYQSLKVSVMAAFLGVKWFLVFYSVKYLYKRVNFNKYVEIPRKILYAIILLFGGIENIYYLRNIHDLFSVYSNLVAPTFLCGISVTLITFLFMGWSNTVMDKICLILMLENLVFSTKAKGYAAALLGVVIFFWVIKLKKVIKIHHIIVMGISVIILVWNKIYFYYVWGAKHSYSRAVLTVTGFQILKDYFPLGAGWGTFGSYYAARCCLLVYYIYGLGTHFELGINSGVEFSMDSYLASVMGESGFIGLLMLTFFIVALFYMVNKVYKVDKRVYAAGIFSICYLIITFVEETGFANPALMGLAIVMGIIISKSEIFVYNQQVNKNERIFNYNGLY